MLDGILVGLNTALEPWNLFYCFVGVFLGTFVGVMPGIGSLSAISMLLPMTFYLEPSSALIMLAGIFYGTAYGGSTAAILINVPGTPGSSVVCLDGYPLAQQGRASAALFLVAVGSFFAASVGILLMMGFSPAISRVALSFTSADYFSFMMVGLVFACTVSEGAFVKAISMIALGAVCGLVGADSQTGIPRFTFGSASLYDGFNVAIVAMGLFGVSEIISSMRGKVAGNTFAVSLRNMLPTRTELSLSWRPAIRGTLIGSVLGVLPGVGGTVACFLSYSVEKKVAKDPSRFGRGAIEGVVSPESANNAADQTGFIPTMTLGIPAGPSMALILGVLFIHGITPGPTMLVEHPDIFWGLVMSFWIGNVMLLILNIPLIGLWVRLLNVPYTWLYPSVLLLICLGVYALNNDPEDIVYVAGFGALGYCLRYLQFPVAPFLLSFVLAPMMEEYFIRALVMSNGSFSVFVTSPVSGALVTFTAAYLVFMTWVSLRRRGKLDGVPA